MACAGCWPRIPLPSPTIERARPLLGTTVRIRVGGLPEALANEAISGAFHLIADIHQLMSFHEPGSDLSCLNREAGRRPVQVAPHTRAVLRGALELSRVSHGLFDPTTAPALVRDGLLPAPEAESPCAEAHWQDIVINDDGRVSFRKPLWLDLGGIAKGYAVDCAYEYLATRGAQRICVEAGGDLRLRSPVTERVQLAAPVLDGAIPVVEVDDAAVASSGSQLQPDAAGYPQWLRPHIDPRTGQPCPADRFVTVVAARCMDADALTKVVMIAGDDAAPVLEHYQAQAFLQQDGAWHAIP